MEVVQSRRNQHRSSARVRRLRPPTTGTLTDGDTVVIPAVAASETGLPKQRQFNDFHILKQKHKYNLATSHFL